jgi:flagellar basal-body rod protein FlgB
MAAATGPAASAGQQMTHHTGQGAPGSLDASNLSPGSTEAFIKYRTPLAPSLDGNTVDAQLEQSAFAENAVRYQATLTLLTTQFRSLMTAITGQ